MGRISNDTKKEFYTSYVIGRIEAQLEGFAASGNILKEELARSVGTFLLGTSNGAVMGTPNSVPNLPNTSTTGGETGRKVEMDERTHCKPQRKKVKWTPARRKAQGDRMRALWKKKQK